MSPDLPPTLTTAEVADCQRWRERRDRYRPAGEVIDPSRYGVEVIAERDARPFVEAHHYSGTYPAARLAVGLHRARRWVTPELVGVAVFSVGVQPAALQRWAGVEAREGVELGRFVLFDDVPGNGESWFLARAFRALRAQLPDVRAVLSYSDPLPRHTVAGALVTPGHVGVIYQAFNARYHGTGSARSLYLDDAGRVVSPRAFDKIRNAESGWEGAARRLVASGAPTRAVGEEPAAWLKRVKSSLRAVRHPGNHVYTWALDGAPGVADLHPYPRRPL